MIVMITSKNNSRSLILDVIRGFTIILMFFFHFCFDLNNFGIIHVDIINGKLWYLLPRIIVFLFLFVVGISLKLVHSIHINWISFIKRFLKIFLCALGISLVTYFLFPDHWIYFGTLHAIALISLFSLPFLKHPKICLIAAFSLFIPSVFFHYNLPWFSLPHQSWDYISPFPWIGASLLGIFAAHHNVQNIILPSNKITTTLSFLGKHSLVIYLIHQPIFFSLTYSLYWFLKR
jgi:uncharacterized membrane protein